MRPRQASPRALAIAGGVVALVVVAVVLGIVLSGGKKGATGNFPTIGSATDPIALQGSTQIRDLYKGIPQSGLILGKPNAPATLTEFIDLQCPVCKAFENTQMPGIVRKYVRTGQLNIRMEPWEIRDFPGGPGDSARGQAATIAAAAQNRAFQFAGILYLNQGTENTGWLNENMVGTAASSVDGLRPQKVLDNLGSSQVKATVSEVDRTAAAQGYNSTPTLLLNHKGQKAHVVARAYPDPTQLDNQIQSAIAG
ncbi:MAG TPA: thioredoxin domain-containing protein [Gaiellaceae bacterium]|nr:thioredoxin domain-containing protein [Gaiellaceae bacterium]